MLLHICDLWFSFFNSDINTEVDLNPSHGIVALVNLLTFFMFLFLEHCGNVEVDSSLDHGIVASVNLSHKLLTFNYILSFLRS